VLPSLLLIGVGFGLVVAPSFSTATLGVPRQDSGVASAMVSTSQQVGGSIATALLSTLAVSATTDYIVANGPSAQAAVEGYTTAFWWAAAIFAVGAIVTGALLRSGVKVPVHGAPEPVAA
jgi:sugar phosphate permease